jgi:hypothetical protein
MVGHVFNAVNVDGDFGLLSKDGASSFDEVTVKTDDPAFRDPDDAAPLMAAGAAGETGEVLSSLTYAELDPVIGAAVNRWSTSTLFNEAFLDILNEVSFLIADLTGDTLALAVDDTVIIDVDAAGHGWFIDDTPYQDSEFVPGGNDEELLANAAGPADGDMDLLTVVMHELGHVFGYQDLDPADNPTDLMSAELDEGVRRLPDGASAAQGHSGDLVSLDLTAEDSASDQLLGSLVNDNPWVVKYLVDGAGDLIDPNDDIVLIIDDEDPTDGTTTPDAAPTNGNKGGKDK